MNKMMKMKILENVEGERVTAVERGGFETKRGGGGWRLSSLFPKKHRIAALTERKKNRNRKPNPRFTSHNISG